MSKMRVRVTKWTIIVRKYTIKIAILPELPLNKHVRFVYHKSMFMKKCLELNTLKHDLKRWHDSNDTFYMSLSWKGLIMKQGVPNVQSSCIGILDEIHAVWSSLFFQIPSCQRQMTCQASYLHIYKKIQTITASILTTDFACYAFWM